MEGTSLRPFAPCGNGPDLRRIGIHPDCWYPFALSKDLKPNGTQGAMFAEGGEKGTFYFSSAMHVKI